MAEELRDINLLFPPFAEQVYKFEKEAREKYNFYIFETLRPIEKQRENWAKGRKQNPDGTWSVVDKAAVVTNAKPGLSFHGFGLAFDTVPDGNTKKEGVQWTWDDYDLTKTEKQPIPWREVARIAKLYGFEWAGDWVTFSEVCHYQRTYGFSAGKLLEIFTSDGLDGVWKTIERDIKENASLVSLYKQGESGCSGISAAAGYPVALKLFEPDGVSGYFGLSGKPIPKPGVTINEELGVWKFIKSLFKR